MQFQVPQFIEMEDRIFGPLTFKQFVYIVGGVGLATIFVRILPYPINWALAMLAGALGAAFAFVEIHKKPLSYFVAAAFFYLVRKKLYIWKKRKIIKNPEEQNKAQSSKSQLAPVSANKLKDLAWGLDINEHIAQIRLKEQLEKHKMNELGANFKI